MFRVDNGENLGKLPTFIFSLRRKVNEGRVLQASFRPRAVGGTVEDVRERHVGSVPQRATLPSFVGVVLPGLLYVRKGPQGG